MRGEGGDPLAQTDHMLRVTGVTEVKNVDIFSYKCGHFLLVDLLAACCGEPGHQHSDRQSRGGGVQGERLKGGKLGGGTSP